MPELGSYGSVRGARGNSRPYREHRAYTVDRSLRPGAAFVACTDLVAIGGIAAAQARGGKVVNDPSRLFATGN